VRIAFTLAACIGLAACTGSRDVSSSPPPTAAYEPPPTVSYKVTGNNVSQANVKAENYCARFGHSAFFQGLRPVRSGNVAAYICEGAPLAGGQPPPLAGSNIAQDLATRLKQ
jgi:hypothetical protein